MEIVISVNSIYVMPATVMLCSLFENNQESHIRIHALLGDNEEQSRESIEKIVNKYGKEVLFYHMMDYPLPDFPLDFTDYITKESYYRLYITEILPASIDKVLYLDSDLIVCNIITDLWNQDVTGVAVAAVPGVTKANAQPADRLGYDVNKGYFNAGVLLINLKYWRENHLWEQFVKFIRENKGKLVYHDQDVLNYVLQDSKKDLPVRYNLERAKLFKDCYCLKNSPESEIEQAFYNPVIIHYTAKDKPWFSNCKHPMKNYFEHYRQLTEWKDAPLGKRTDKLYRRILFHIACIIRREKSFYESFFDVKYRKGTVVNLN